MTEPSQSTTGRKRKKTRSPNFPAINLETAIQRLSQIYKAEGRHDAPLESVAAAMDYNTKSSSFLQTLGALNAFGLIETEGKGDGRQIKLSQRGFDIVIDEAEETVEREEAIKAAALSPAIHKVVWEEYGTNLPSDNTVKLFLVKEHGFNPKSAPSFIESYKATIALANLGLDATIADENEGRGSDDDAPEVLVQAGQYVQWSSQGADQFESPRKVLDLSDDGQYAFVEGTSTGIKVEQLTVVQAAEQAPAPPKQGPKPPPQNPFASPLRDEGFIDVHKGMSSETSQIGDGVARLAWPSKMSADDYDDLEYWLKGVLRKAKRSVGEHTENQDDE